MLRENRNEAPLQLFTVAGPLVAWYLVQLAVGVTMRSRGRIRRLTSTLLPTHVHCGNSPYPRLSGIVSQIRQTRNLLAQARKQG